MSEFRKFSLDFGCCPKTERSVSFSDTKKCPKTEPFGTGPKVELQRTIQGPGPGWGVVRGKPHLAPEDASDHKLHKQVIKVSYVLPLSSTKT